MAVVKSLACWSVDQTFSWKVRGSLLQAKAYSLSCFLKALLHEAIFPATCNATDDKSIARQVAEFMLHAATYLATLQKTRNLVYFFRNPQLNFSMLDMLRR